MKKILILVGLVVASVIGYWLISPLFIDKMVSEEFPLSEEESDTSQVISQGEFEGFDRVHYGSGTASLIETAEGYVVRFENDFEVANGPDLYVGFGKDGKYVKGTEISRLKGNIGSQNYEVPEDINIEEYNEIWVWCRVFSVGFARASLSELP